MALRIGICALLLLGVFHSIFLHEGSLAYERLGRDWHDLSRAQQWRAAWQFGPAELGRTLCLIRPLEAVGSVAFMGATLLLGALRWHGVLRAQGIPLSLARSTQISFIAHFFNSFLLGSTGGDLLKAYYAARETHHRKPEAVVAVVVDRLLGLVSMLLFAVVFMLPNRAFLAAHPRLAALALVVLAMFTAGVGLSGLFFHGGLRRRWPRAREWVRHLPRAELLERSLDASRRFGRNRRALARAVGLSMLVNLMCVLQIWALARGLDLEIPPLLLAMIVPTIICLAALPITPNGLGVRENVYVWMLAVPEIAVPPTRALALSLLAYAGSLVWSVAGGLVYLAFRDRRAQAGPDSSSSPEA
jgi:uncharacterized protein (TIRG00374 family)